MKGFCLYRYFYSIAIQFSAILTPFNGKELIYCHSAYTACMYCASISKCTKGCSTMIFPIQLGDIDITHVVVRVHDINITQSVSDTIP